MTKIKNLILWGLLPLINSVHAYFSIFADQQIGCSGDLCAYAPTKIFCTYTEPLDSWEELSDIQHPSKLRGRIWNCMAGVKFDTFRFYFHIVNIVSEYPLTENDYKINVTVHDKIAPIRYHYVPAELRQERDTAVFIEYIKERAYRRTSEVWDSTWIFHCGMIVFLVYWSINERKKNRKFKELEQHILSHDKEVAKREELEDNLKTAKEDLRKLTTYYLMKQGF